MNKTRFMMFVTMLCSIQLVLMLTPLGFIPIGPVNATTLHIPVILAGILLGIKGGGILGLVFGLMSTIRGTFDPISGFLFSPFAPAPVGYESHFGSLIIALVPRILLGILSACIYKFLRQKNFKFASSGITALLCTLLHTFMVLGLIYLFFGSAYAHLMGVELTHLTTALAGIVLTNGLIEAALAFFVITALAKILEPLLQKMGITERKGFKHV